ncbi:AAA family ATPase [Flammeovirga kamogawensis]|uniref:AAA family ATPase n=1 Tax=Flammeovirga kamogawensis TaxID=373891 RepID=A0ABX8H485_9BACT|nr:AAA family ATPase [Flammeovirga kamogawensis]MBB6461788.1 putative ATPase/serine phosphatase RsbU (regulator of sigma subunit) [Flammeovirga kamogawensis]QWG10704.1 AAA family ATPase [Flammeovirga kamogawensis]TRX63806.1 AAA family ATPase [Flammeovirga kamogawensis]
MTSDLSSTSVKNIQENSNYRICISSDKQIHKLLKSSQYAAYIKYESNVLENLSLLDQPKSDFSNIVYRFGVLSRWAELDYDSISLIEKCNLSIKLINKVAEIHAQNRIHYNISPNTVCVTEDNTIELIGYELSSEVGVSTESQSLLMIDENNWNYIAPEQTGRINSKSNYKTDQYNVGICLYELFTGTLPFKGKDKLELIHAHIAYQPKLVHHLSDELPQFLSEIIKKLLQKSPDLRYNNFKAIVSDLEKVRDFFEGKTKNLPKTAGDDDTKIKLEILDKLYGRNIEKDKFIASYQNMKDNGLSILALSGVSGIGKTSFIREAIYQISDEKLITISGKFDQFQRNIPYLAISQILNNLASQFLLKSDEDINELKELIAKNIGNNGKILTELSSELKLVVDDTAELSPLGSLESINRFIYTVAQFLRAVLSQHPLIIFIDDIQWADSSSIVLLNAIINDLQDEQLFFIFASRIEDNDSFKNLIHEIKDIKKLVQVELGPLEENDVLQMMEDIFIGTDKGSIKKLSKTIIRNTDGNPFYVREFFNQIIQDDKNIYFAEAKRKWEIDNEQIEQSMATENVANVSLKKKDILSDEVNDQLAIASLLGNRFDVVILSSLIGKKTEDVIKTLRETVKHNLLVPLSDNYKYYDKDVNNKVEFQFIHDKINQTYYNHLPEERQNEWHLKIAQLILSDPELEDSKLKLKAVNHANICSEIIRGRSDATKYAKYNLEAAITAIDNAAFDSAKNFLLFAKKYLNETPTRKDYIFWIEVRLKLAQTYYATAAYDDCLKTINECIQYAESEKHIYEAEFSKIQLNIVLGEYSEAIDLITKGLRKKRIKLNKNPKQKDIIFGLMKTKFLLRSHSLKKLNKMPDLDNERAQQQLQLLGQCFLPAYISRPLLFPILVYKVIQISVKYGNSPISAFGFSCYSLLNSGIGQFDDAKKFGEFTEELQAKYNYKPLECSIEQNLVSSFYPIFRGYKSSIEKSNLAILSGLESGDTLFTGLLHLHKSAQLLVSSENLVKVSTELAKSIDVCNSLSEVRSPLLKGIAQVANSLSDPSNPEFDWEEIHSYYEEINSLGDLCNSYLFKGIEYFYLGDYEAAYDTLKMVKKSEDALMGVFYQNEFVFYYTLSVLLSKASTTKEIKGCKSYIARLGQLAKINEKDFSVKHALSSLLFKIRTNKSADLMEIDALLDRSKEFNQPNLSALCADILLSLYKEKSQATLLQHYYRTGIKAYNAWGAVNALEHFVERHNIIDGDLSAVESQPQNTTVNLDLNTILKATNVIAKELSVEKLLESILKVAIENAGANTGLFITKVENELYLKAKSLNADSNEIELVNIPIYSIKNELPISIINEVINNKKELILEDAIHENTFNKSGYIKLHNTRSVLCYPILVNNEVKSIIYLENNLINGAFTEKHLEVIKILSAQVSISLENAYLYQTLEDKVNERTIEIRHQKDIIQKRNLDITDSIKYAKRIQSAILPIKEYVDKALTDNFILYKPKDIIAGDFYWIEEIDNLVLFAAADCTGHGVPGAMVSIVCHNALNRAIKEYKLRKPADILDKVREIVIDSFSTSSQDVKDGMDISLCALDRDNMILQYAGAYNNLHVVKNRKIISFEDTVYLEDDEKVMITVKGNRQPVGRHKKTVPFTNHEVNVEKGDIVYVFSDGFPDQFGGPKNQKFLAKSFKKLLFDISQKPLSDQHDLLNYRFEEWKGKQAQTDDVCVIGMKI